MVAFSAKGLLGILIGLMDAEYDDAYSVKRLLGIIIGLTTNAIAPTQSRLCCGYSSWLEAFSAVLCPDSRSRKSCQVDDIFSVLDYFLLVIIAKVNVGLVSFCRHCVQFG